MVWILPTRNRPTLCQRALDAAAAHGFTGPGVVSLDGCDYPGLCLPPGWSLIRWSEPVGHVAQLQWLYQSYPEAARYGVLTDDQLAETDTFQQRLEAAAGDWCIASAEDGLLHGRNRLGRPWIAAAPCFGGELVRALGFLALPDGIHTTTDCVWVEVAGPLDLLRFCPNVRVRHLHWRNGTRPRDETDAIGRAAADGNDRRVMARWRESERDPAIARIRAAMARARAA